jgi:S1-C subfamily serine protease
VSVPRAFDGDDPAFETATGFVVDAERGIILSNRHVVKPGPAVAEAVFLDHEEVAVWTVYRDPVHDFGFYRYDPREVKFMRPAEIELAPENARVGTEIRVVGNDAGEKLSILAGTLARLDREAPRYGGDRYSDFNTFYYQAASGTSGGSSGSPVVDISGRAVALNAGGSLRAASSFYLPLDRVVRALDHLRRGSPVPRGTLQAVFRHRPYDELRRLGLRPETEARLRERFPAATGMLSVDEIVPGGPAHGKLEVGDVVVEVGGEFLTGFTPLESILDERVGEPVRFQVERGGEPLGIEMRVQDLSDITPAAYLEVGGSMLHPLSYHQARNHAVPVAGLYLAWAGYVFSRAKVPTGIVITAVGGERVTTLEDFEAAMARFSRGARVPVRYFALANPRTERVAVITHDRRWFPMRRCTRDDATGGWPCSASPAPPPQAPAAPTTTRFPREDRRPARDLAPSLAMVDFDIPYRIDGVYGDKFRGTGLVVDAERGLVVVDRETVPVALGDVRIIFAASVEVPGEVVYLHPTHNFAVVSYDPALLGDTPIRSARFRSRPLEEGDEVWLVGLSERGRVVARQTRIAQLESPELPVTQPPRFREMNLELIALADSAPTVGGVLADGKGRVLAQWASFSAQGKKLTRAFFAGIAAERLLDVVTPLQESRAVGWRSLGAEFRPLTLAEARGRGLSDAAARRLEGHDARRRRVLSVARLTAGTAAAELLEEGDLLLSIDGQPATSFEEVERRARAQQVNVSVLRGGDELTLEIATTPLDGRGTDRFLLWSGALLQAPHRAVSVQRGIPREGIYVSWFWYGSPADRYGLRSTRRIVAVDGAPTTDLDAFLAAVAERPDRGAVRLRTLRLDGKAEVITLKLDLQFWPTLEFRRTDTAWERIEH